MAVWRLDAYTVTNTDNRVIAYFRIDRPGWLQRVKIIYPTVKLHVFLY